MGRYDSEGFSSPLPGYPADAGFDRYGAPPGSDVDESARPTETVQTGLPGVGVIFGQRNPAGPDSDLQPGQAAGYGREGFTGEQLASQYGAPPAGPARLGSQSSPSQLGRHRMTAYDEQYWLDNTPAGRLYHDLGIPTRRSLDAVDRDIEAVNAEYRARFERDMTEEERAKVRAGAERRVSPAFTGELTLEDVHRMGWGFSIEHKAAGVNHGIAVQTAPGVWEGDPAIVQRAKVSEQVHDARLRDWQETGRPGYIRGVA